MVDDTDELVRELNESWEDDGGNSTGGRWTREELHERKEVSQCDEVENEHASKSDDRPNMKRGTFKVNEQT
jgi:hypothetical protein